MSYVDQHIIATYSRLFEGLSAVNKIQLFERLTKVIKKEKSTKTETFYKSFGAFSSEKSADEIIRDIKSSRKFKIKEINF